MPTRSNRPSSSLEQASHAFSKTLYESAQAGAGPGATGSASAGGGPTDGKKPGEEEAIDAEFEVKE